MIAIVFGLPPPMRYVNVVATAVPQTGQTFGTIESGYIFTPVPAHMYGRGRG